VAKAKFRDISRTTNEQKLDAKAFAEAEVTRLRLGTLRTARLLSQEEIAERLEMPQGAVSRLEKQSDSYVRTVRRFVEAAGGKLSLLVTFPDSEDAIEFVGIGDLAVIPSDLHKK
jgi:transcriptional regulator with XRE-family HTH domain